MNGLLDIAFAFLLIVGHAPLLAHALWRLRRGYVPPTWQFGAMGIFLYYDLGLLLQFAGLPYRNAFFPILGDANEEQLLMLVIVVAASPYLLWVGSSLISKSAVTISHFHLVRFAPRMHGLFLILVLPASLALAAFGLFAMWGAVSIAAIKMEWVSFLGSAYIAFMAPMFSVAFLVRTDFGRQHWGRVLVITLVACSACATLFLGQRTMTLLPVLFLSLFYFRFRLRSLVFSVAILVSFAAGMAWFYKGFAVEQSLPIEERVLTVLNDDFTRANVLLRAIQESELVGTRLLPAPGQGYLYAASLYIPRKILPQKGHSTTAYFTGLTAGEDVEFLTWGLGVGFLEQISLNFGSMALAPGILIYGMLLGLLDNLRQRFPGTLVGVCLGAVWMSGYDASAVILYHGSMVIFAILLELVFSRSEAPGNQPALGTATWSPQHSFPAT